MINFDMWYGDDEKKIVRVDSFFNDNTATYWGWAYDANGKRIGDYTCDDSVELEKRFFGGN